GDEPGNEITVTEDGEVLCTAIVQEDLSWSCTPSKPLEDGEHTITATETDPTGSESAPSDEVTFTVDTTPPNPPVITGPEDGSVTTDRTPLIEGTGDEPFNEITVTDLEGNELCTAIVQSDKTWGCTPVTPLEDGDHTIIATEKDPTGNVSDPSNEVTFTITPPVIKDLDPPNPPVITGPEDGETVTTDTPEITGAGDEPGNTITVTDEDGNEVCTAIVTENKTWACTPENPFEDGPHTLTATETDDEGNESDPSDPIDFIVDTTPPKPPVITNPSDGDVTTNNTPTITGTGDEPGNTIIVTEPGGKQVCTAVVQPNKTWSCTPSKPMPDGDHTITATETDPAGNISDPSNEVSFTIDSTPPSDPTIGPSNGTELTGTTDPDTTITVRDEDGNEVEGCVDIKPDNKGTWICWPKEKLNEGDKVTVTAKDPAGNESNPVPGIITGLGIDIAFKQRNPLQTQIVTGRNFNPGETVCAFVYSEPMPLGCKVADAKGEATWTFTVPSGFAAGSHRVEIVGKISGKVSDTFMVTLVPRVETGGIAVQTGSGLAAVAMVLVAVGAATLIGVRRYLGNVN
ncbi:MAG: Ig-like domain-containing protein, partial [Propionibacteriaceae bacterium]|nr:Ig-like domain-containing protein [Propionibacteriaceae bacterium]